MGRSMADCLRCFSVSGKGIRNRFHYGSSGKMDLSPFLRHPRKGLPAIAHRFIGGTDRRIADESRQGRPKPPHQFFRPLRDYADSCHRFPPINRWAIFDCPSRDKITGSRGTQHRTWTCRTSMSHPQLSGASHRNSARGGCLFRGRAVVRIAV